MGWLRGDDHDDLTYDHEGHVVMVVNDDHGRWRELGFDDRVIPVDRWGHKLSIRIQIACSCGWRSQRLVAPLGTDWTPCCVSWPSHRAELHEDAAAEVWWQQHRRHVGPKSDDVLWYQAVHAELTSISPALARTFAVPS